MNRKCHAGPLAEDPEAGPSGQEQGVVFEKEETREDHTTRSRGEMSRPRLQRGNGVQQEDQPFMELQRSGFSMLERELGGIRRSVGGVNFRLCRMQMLLRPLGRIADDLGRLAEAAERFASAAPPPAARSTTLTLPPAGHPRRQTRSGASLPVNPRKKKKFS
ncbi:hypothetical protein AGOR_G00172100 [Albula goreensis]|uniref:Uncharacterized protein n=1 Tax=Albula goreensis TaxID=1534307 RepID=A0A8T3CWV6_9TELE|nr:hypothetical protein AGOR_G00172100 [Albula goreensis]